MERLLLHWPSISVPSVANVPMAIMNGNPWLLVASVALVPIVTYVISSFQFQYALFMNKNKRSSDLIIPVIPYWVPFLGHAIPMALDSGAFVSKVM